jgi:hypothetical protein
MSLVSHSLGAALGAFMAAQAAASMGCSGSLPRISARMRSRDSSVFSCSRACACTLLTSSSSVSPVMTVPDGPQVRLILMAILLLVGVADLRAVPGPCCAGPLMPLGVAAGRAATGPARRGTVDVAPTRLVEILSESLTKLVNETDYVKRGVEAR